MRANIEPKEGNILTRIFSRRSTHAGSRDVLPPLTSSTNAPAVERTAVTKKTPQELAGLTNFRVVAATGRSSGGFFEGAFGNDDDDDEEDDDDNAKPRRPLTELEAKVQKLEDGQKNAAYWLIVPGIMGFTIAMPIAGAGIGFATLGAAVTSVAVLTVPVVIFGLGVWATIRLGRRIKNLHKKAANHPEKKAQPAKK